MKKKAFRIGLIRTEKPLADIKRDEHGWAEQTDKMTLNSSDIKFDIYKGNCLRISFTNVNPSDEERIVDFIEHDWKWRSNYYFKHKVKDAYPINKWLDAKDTSQKKKWPRQRREMERALSRVAKNSAGKIHYYFVDTDQHKINSSAIADQMLDLARLTTQKLMLIHPQLFGKPNTLTNALNIYESISADEHDRLQKEAIVALKRGTEDTEAFKKRCLLKLDSSAYSIQAKLFEKLFPKQIEFDLRDLNGNTFVEDRLFTLLGNFIKNHYYEHDTIQLVRDKDTIAIRSENPACDMEVIWHDIQTLFREIDKQAHSKQLAGCGDPIGLAIVAIDQKYHDPVLPTQKVHVKEITTIQSPGTEIIQTAIEARLKQNSSLHSIVGAVAMQLNDKWEQLNYAWQTSPKNQRESAIKSILHDIFVYDSIAVLNDKDYEKVTESIMVLFEVLNKSHSRKRGSSR